MAVLSPIRQAVLTPVWEISCETLGDSPPPALQINTSARLPSPCSPHLLLCPRERRGGLAQSPPSPRKLPAFFPSLACPPLGLHELLSGA